MTSVHPDVRAETSASVAPQIDVEDAESRGMFSSVRGRRAELALLALGLAIVMAFAGIVIGVNRAATTRAEEINERNRLASQEMVAKLLEGYLAASLRSIFTQGQAHAWSMRPGDRGDAAALATIHDRLGPSSTAVALVDLGERPVAVAGDLRLVPPMSDPGWAALRADLRAGKPGVSSIMQVNGVGVVGFAVPVLGPRGRPVGVLVHIERMDKSDLADYARQLPVGPRASVSVVDARRMIVASDRRETVGRRSAGYPDIVYRAAVSGLVAVDRTGVRRVAVYAPVHFGGWVVIVEQDADQFYGGLRSNGQRIELMLLGFIVAAGLAVVVVNSRRHAALAQLAEGARRDTLTGLPNRRVFQERLGEQSRAGLAGAVVFCDLDGFKAINDTYGHDTGDALLVVVAERLRACVRPDDVVSRLGGDEFTVLLTEATRTTEAVAVARRIEAALAEPMSLPGARLSGIGVSCGVAMIGAAGERSLHAADLAMYRAKHSGSGVAVACEVVADVSADALPRAARDR